MDDRAVGITGTELFDILEMLFLVEDILEIDRFRAKYSAELFVCGELSLESLERHHLRRHFGRNSMRDGLVAAKKW